ncbi:MAG TPA: protein kinase [Pseudomonadota bacterium]|nr:protein kinase [Pseudomonadota bacterium]
MEACVSENTVAGFLDGRLSREESALLQEHVLGCSSCRLLLVALASGTSLSIVSEESTTDSTDAMGESGVARDSFIGVDQDVSVYVPPKQIDEYRILGLLGQGSMGRVFFGRDTRLDRLVAMKFLNTNMEQQHDGRLLIEARAIARIQHSNVVVIYRVGEHNGQLYLVSEFVRGLSLDRISKPQPWPQVHAIGVALTRGLREAHHQGILHRDIKPANAMLTPNGSVKLLDFGLAKLAHTHDSALDGAEGRPAEMFVSHEQGPPHDQSRNNIGVLTKSGALVGTPRYMAPELWRGDAMPPNAQSIKCVSSNRGGAFLRNLVGENCPP